MRDGRSKEHSTRGGKHMGLLDGLLGNASEIEVSKIEGDFAQVMSAGERVEKAYLELTRHHGHLNIEDAVGPRKGVLGARDKTAISTAVQDRGRTASSLLR
jgi:hypothetical protein